jgi:hypothetical protein
MSNGTIAVSQLEMLTQSGTGTITINPPNTDTDRVLTLPDETGTVLTGVSSLVAGNLTGSVPTSAMPAGSVLQVVQSYRTSGLSTTSATYVDILSATLTPTSSSSKFLVMCTGQESIYGGDGNSYSVHTILRNSTEIYLGDASASATRASAGRFGRQGSNYSDAVSFMYLDSPSTASAITYKWQFKSIRGPSWTVFIGGAGRDSYVGDARVPTNLIIMEIAG